MQTDQIIRYLQALQDRYCTFVEDFDGTALFDRRVLEDKGGLSRPRVLSEGTHFEKAAFNFTHSKGSALPKAATERRPEMGGRSFQAVSLSWILHPRNPYAPTTHGNLRYFVAEKKGELPVWWFGGGIDLTPYYGFTADAVHWHRTIKSACDPFGAHIYPDLKENCDRYFYLPHRKEGRGIGGIFFDDWNQDGFETCFEFLQSIGDHFLPAYQPILEMRAPMDYGPEERAHQLYRRGRYVEFNLLYDRGTKYGLQSGRRIESVLASMPPLVRFDYDRQPSEGSAEERLVLEFLKPKDWASL
jgi:coproporphyrinogen III oxidase